MKKDLNHYISLFQNIGRYDFIQDIKLEKILYLFSGYVSHIYYEDIQDPDTPEELKEIKAHTLFIYLGAVIESLVYSFVERKLSDEKSKRKYLEITEYIKLQKIEQTENLYICRLDKKAIHFNDSINFHGLIQGLKDKKLMDDKIINKIDAFRKMRNLVHINVFLNSSEYKLIEKIEQAFIDAKDILDSIEDTL